MILPTPAVQLSGVRIERGGRTVLSNVALQVPRGSITTVLGPSGSGKSTMLAALTGELRPTEGRSVCSEMESHKEPKHC